MKMFFGVRLQQPLPRPTLLPYWITQNGNPMTVCRVEYYKWDGKRGKKRGRRTMEQISGKAEIFGAKSRVSFEVVSSTEEQNIMANM